MQSNHLQNIFYEIKTENTWYWSVLKTVLEKKIWIDYFYYNLCNIENLYNYITISKTVIGKLFVYN